MELETYRGYRDPHSAVVTRFIPGEGEKLTVSTPTQRLWGGLHIAVVEGPDVLVDGLQMYLGILSVNDPGWSSVRRHTESGGLCLSYDISLFNRRVSPAQLLSLQLLADLKRFSNLLIRTHAELVLEGNWDNPISVEIPHKPSEKIIVVN